MAEKPSQLLAETSYIIVIIFRTIVPFYWTIRFAPHSELTQPNQTDPNP
jgi:hypothetical protein